MRRITLFLAVLLLAASASAQLGRQPLVRAGTPEDKALAEIDGSADSAARLALLDKFLAEFGQTEMALLAYERYIAIYVADKNYDKAFEYGERALQSDPENLGVMVTMMRAAVDMGNTAKALEYGDRAGALLQRFHQAGPPAEMDEAAWKERKAMLLERASDQISYVQYTAFNIAYQTQDPEQKLALFERYLKNFPDSPYASNARIVSAATLLLQADQWSESGPNDALDKAEAFANRAVEMLAAAEKPEQLTDEQWAQQKGLQNGLAHSVLGQVHIRRGRNTQAVEAFTAAAPLLQPDPTTYSRNQYRLGFAYLNLRRTNEARAAFTEAAAANTPYRDAAQKKLAEIGAPARRRRP